MSEAGLDPTSPYLLTEIPIQRQSDIYVRSDDALKKHVRMINANIEFIDEALRLYEHRSTDELMVHRLAARALNSGAAAVLLARSGYYNQCVAIVRDIMETTLLLDLFGRRPSEIAEWTNGTQDYRDRNFSAVHVRLKLEKIETENGGTPLSRKETYKRFCTYGSHPTPDSFSLISPDMMTRLGPFPDYGRFKAMVGEIVQHFTFAAVIIGEHIPHDDPKVLALKSQFYDLADTWANEFLRPKPAA